MKDLQSKSKTELLAPAKDKVTAIEAINCGADAVYIGASAFGARQNACNSIEDIKYVTNYAHKFWAKVFVTVNTILNDAELIQAVELVKQLDKIGVDAVLVQDMGLLKRLAELKLNLPIHMSTQCDNREKEKIDFFNKIGVSRVVLARELSIDKIREIHQANPEIELECFVHGALCVSYSGQCYLSAYIGGRSANRGECAQPCRKKYTVMTDKGEIIAKNIYPLCLKDFNASKHLKDMINSGVYSFKIEGRLKDKGYVKNIVAFYRQELDKYSQKTSSGKSVYQFTPNPEKSFNRGFTDYFLKERCNCFSTDSPKSKGELIGKVTKLEAKGFVIKTDKKLSPQDGLCFIENKEIKGFKINSVKTNDTNKNEILIIPNNNVNIKIGTLLYRNQDIEFEKLLSMPVKRQIGINISYKNNKLTIVDEDNISIEEKIQSTESAQNQEKMNQTFIKQFSKTGESDFYINDIKIDSSVPFMPISAINELRRTGFEKLMNKRLESFKRDIQKPIKLAKYYKNEVDYRANISNKEAEEFYAECGCTVLEPALEIKLPNRQIELMRTKHCIKHALNMCKSPKNLILVDEYNKKYPLKFDCKNCEMCVLSPL